MVRQSRICGAKIGHAAQSFRIPGSGCGPADEVGKPNRGLPLPSCCAISEEALVLEFPRDNHFLCKALRIPCAFGAVSKLRCHYTSPRISEFPEYLGNERIANRLHF